MYELIQLTEKTFFMDCPSKVGFVLTAPGEAVLIDAGSDKDAGKKVKKILDERGWKLNAIYNTHSHADHIGGNAYLQSQTGCKIYAPAMEQSVTENPIFEPLMLYGGFPPEELQNKFLMAKESKAEPLTEDALPEGLSLIQLPGHSYRMVGFRTDDGVVFLADALSSAETLEKYQVGFLYDVKRYLETLEAVKEMQADWFVPAHAPHTQDIGTLAQMNIDKTMEIAAAITAILAKPMDFEECLAKVFDRFGLSMNITQRVLIGSTVKSYLSFLKSEGKITFCFENNRMLWKQV